MLNLFITGLLVFFLITDLICHSVYVTLDYKSLAFKHYLTSWAVTAANWQLLRGFAEEKASLLTALKFSGPFKKGFPMQWVVLDPYQGLMGSSCRCNPTQIKQRASAKESMGWWVQGVERAQAFLMCCKAEGGSIPQWTQGRSLQPTISTSDCHHGLPPA